MPKSNTHQKVIKNGIESWIPKGVWDKMIEENRLEGFSAVASTPPEVQILKQKKTETVEDDKATEENTDSASNDLVDESLLAEKVEIKVEEKTTTKKKK